MLERCAGLARSFQSTISKWVQDNERALEAVAKEAIQELAIEADKPRAKGGRMPVDTSFLRNSMAAARNSIPSGPSAPTDGFSATDHDMTPVTLVINQIKLGDRFVVGFTANYAQFMENKYFFVRHAAQNWQQHVDKAVRKVKRAARL